MARTSVPSCSLSVQPSAGPRPPCAEPSSRRRLLATAALIAPASLLPASALLAGPDPHPAWYREWQELLDWCDHSEDMGGRDLHETPQWQRLDKLEDLIQGTPAATLAGALVQLRILNHWHGEETSLNKRDSDGLAHVIATVERFAGEVRP